MLGAIWVYHNQYNKNAEVKWGVMPCKHSGKDQELKEADLAKNAERESVQAVNQKRYANSKVGRSNESSLRCSTGHK